MCGIFGYWAKEATIVEDQWDILFRGAEERGRDGVGVFIYDRKHHTSRRYRWPNLSYSDVKDDVLKFVINNTLAHQDYVVLGICRAAPETESVKFNKPKEIQQPVEKFWENTRGPDIHLVHNGSVTDSIYDEVKKSFQMKTKIDSEAIIGAYLLNGRNMKTTMEYLSGAFSFLLIDATKDKLYTVSQFNPLAHCYIKGYGYFLHSSNDVLGEVLHNLTGQNYDGVNVWEAWYHHDIEPYSIIETDLESGFQSKQKFRPRFFHPTWDSRDLGTDENTVLVIASGGIDSGLTGHVLKIAGYNPVFVHFSYGQKGQAAESLGIQRLSEHLDIPLIHTDLRDIFDDTESMLIKDDIKINTGTPIGLKSTMAWVPGRNAIFSTITAGIAEDMILKQNLKHVYISSGFAQLSEETGGYPDNSVRFIGSLENMFKFGYITGHRISFLPVMANLLKTEEWILGDKIGFPFQHTVSCDNPKVQFAEVEVDRRPNYVRYEPENWIFLCEECGSTKLSRWAAARAGVKDPRFFYKSGEMNGEDRTQKELVPFETKINKIVDRINLPKDKRDKILFQIYMGEED